MRLLLRRRAGLSRIRFHDLRHTAATLMLSRGVHPKIVAERLGHSTPMLTLTVYSHVTPTMQRAAAEELDNVLSGVRG
jgi:integrase